MSKSNQLDLAEEMSAVLNQDKTKQAKIAQALLYLNQTAELLDNLELYKSSEIVTRIIEKISANDDQYGGYHYSKTAPCGNGMCDGTCRICDPPHECKGCRKLTRNDSGYCFRCEDENEEDQIIGNYVY